KGDLVDRGTVPPASALVFDATGYWQGKPDLGPVELGSTVGVARPAAPQLDRFAFASPRAGQATLKLHSASGRLLASLPLTVQEGRNRMEIPAGIHPGASFATVDLDGIRLHRGAVARVE
ncbi:MAG TPA: hypothetical protein PLQ54_11490, partial [Armatimonadota bacterium]|nr:hypothetical protein [Armatimonadota bacterium]